MSERKYGAATAEEWRDRWIGGMCPREIVDALDHIEELERERDLLRAKVAMLAALDAAEDAVERPKHHCGERGWDPMRDERCPACNEAWRFGETDKPIDQAN